MTVEQILERLHQLADPEKVVYKAKKFGISTQNSLGIYQKDLNDLVKELPKENDLALALFDTGLYEARLLCSKLFQPKDLTADLAEQWILVFDNWEICDAFCMGIFAKSALALEKGIAWTDRTATFEKRSGFTTLAAYCMADKKADNAVFEQLFPLILAQAEDNRIYVKKAVNWLLRNIGKRNKDLHQRALEVAEEVLALPYPAAQWIAKDAIRQLTKYKVRLSDYPRAIYRPK